MKVSIEDMQAYLLERYEGWTTEQSLFMKLVEEIGEVAEVLNMRSGSKSANSGDLLAQLGNELADVIHYAVAIAAISGIDLSGAITSKDRRASAKYGHDTNLEAFMASRES